MKRNPNLKKSLALILALLMLGLCGCKSAPDSSTAPEPSSSQSSSKPAVTDIRTTVTICMDMDLGSEADHSSLLMDIINDFAPELKDNYKFEIESVPGAGVGRESALDHIRVEMMAGGGADLFLCQSPSAADPDLMLPRQTGLFQYPKALMQRNMFLPLDEYIENAIYLEWDKLYPEIMAAGKNEKGQLILPISWTMNFNRFDAQSYTPTVDLPMTFDEMLESEDPGILEAAWTSDVTKSLGAVADYENETPAFTKEELLSQLEGLMENSQHRTMERYESLGSPGIAYFGRINASHFSQYDADSVLIPTYNREGGVTASITSFGAVNINAKEPEGAFRVLELLLSKLVQQDAELLSWEYGAPVHMDLLQSKEKVNAPFEPRGGNGQTVPRWGLTDYNYDRLQELIKEINVVDFVTPVHHELQELYRPYEQAGTQEEREKLVDDAYRRITMMLAES